MPKKKAPSVERQLNRLEYRVDVMEKKQALLAHGWTYDGLWCPPKVICKVFNFTVGYGLGTAYEIHEICSTWSHKYDD
jgi:hypothetical protein